MQRRRNITLAILAALIAADLTFIAVRWPYRGQRVAEGLGRGTASELRFAKLRHTFFPKPGCIFEKAVFARGDVQLATVETLRVEGAWSDVLLLRRRTNRIRLEGARVHIGADLPPPIRDGKKRPETVIGEVIADGTVLEIARPGRLLRFEFPHLEVQDLARSTQIRFRTVARIPEPPGNLTATATLGPWKGGQTPLSGSFDLREADLSRYEAIAGRLSARGTFTGTVDRLEVRGETDTPDFRLTQSPNAMRLQAEYGAVVNVRSVNISLERIRARFLRTVLDAQGAITGKGSDIATVDFTATEARIEDLMKMFGRSEQPALTGPIAFRARAVLSAGDEPFLRKLRLDGSFGIDDARFGRARTQRKVEELSARARGRAEQVEDGIRSESVETDLKGEVALRDGTARLSRLYFRVPGAVAQGGGTYNLLNKQIALSGTLAMAADLPDATTGIKSLLLRPFAWLFDRQKGKGSVVPVRVTGVYPNPKFRLALRGGK